MIPLFWWLHWFLLKKKKKQTREGDGDILDASQRFQGVARFGSEHFLQEIRAVAAEQRLQELGRLLHRWSLGWSKKKESRTSSSKYFPLDFRKNVRRSDVTCEIIPIDVEQFYFFDSDELHGDGKFHFIFLLNHQRVDQWTRWGGCGE